MLIGIFKVGIYVLDSKMGFLKLKKKSREYVM